MEWGRAQPPAELEFAQGRRSSAGRGSAAMAAADPARAAELRLMAVSPPEMLGKVGELEWFVARSPRPDAPMVGGRD